MKRIVIAVVALGALLVALGAAALYAGVYDIAATKPHFQFVHSLLEIAMRRSVAVRGGEIAVPALDDPELAARGRVLYDAHCLGCHGAPGVAPEPYALGLQPAPANLAYTARSWPDGDLYWAIRHGIRMTGMPAWEYRMSEDELWAVVAFVRRLPELSPADYRAMGGRAPVARAPSRASRATGEGYAPDPERGRAALRQYLCLTCHVVPGTVGSEVAVGPPLDDVARRAFLSGTLPNSRENLVRWLRDPHAIDPDSAMPSLGVSERDARDIGAYLESIAE